MAKRSMASTAKKSAKAIIRKIWDNAPESVQRSTESAVIVTMAAAVLTASTLDKCAAAAVQDMAHEINYTWDPFDGFCA